jgi:hypothetical protein
MLPSKHLFFGIIFALILLFIFPQIGFIGFFLILSSTVLIDVDHYLYYVYKKKDWNLRNAFKWFIKSGKKFNGLPKDQRDNVYFGVCFLHGIETIIIFFAFSFYFTFLLFIIVGFIFHQLLDLIQLIEKRISPLKVVSMIYLLIDIKDKELIENYKIK